MHRNSDMEETVFSFLQNKYIKYVIAFIVGIIYIHRSRMMFYGSYEYLGGAIWWPLWILRLFSSVIACAFVFYCDKWFTKNEKNGKLYSIVIVVLIFAVIPSLFNSVHKSNKNFLIDTLVEQQQEQRRHRERVDVQIEIDTKKEKEVGSIGDDIICEHFINGAQVESGDIFAIIPTETLYFSTTITECDKISDVGKARSRLFTLGEENPKKISQNILVVEKGGGSNKGSYADFLVEYILTRVPELTEEEQRAELTEMHSNDPYWEVFFMEHGKYSKLYHELLIALGVSCTIFVLGIACIALLDGTRCVIVSYKNHKVNKEKTEKLRAARQERIQKENDARKRREEKLLEEKEKRLNEAWIAERKEAAKESTEEKAKRLEKRNTFLLEYLGDGYEDKVEIPDNITFTAGGKPIKGTATETKPFGEYTRYKTKTGKCIHTKYGCCGANIAVNACDVCYGLKDCSKCGIGKPRVQPEWYKTFQEVRKEYVKETKDNFKIN